MVCGGRLHIAAVSSSLGPINRLNPTQTHLSLVIVCSTHAMVTMHGAARRVSGGKKLHGAARPVSGGKTLQGVARPVSGGKTLHGAARPVSGGKTLHGVARPVSGGKKHYDSDGLGAQEYSQEKANKERVKLL